MSLMSYKKALAAFRSEPMKGNIDRLIDYDLYHCLLAGSLGTSLKLQEKYKYLPKEFLNWTKICDGGLLFDTVLLSTKGQDDALGLSFDTYDDANTLEAYNNFALPSGYCIFAIRSYGDPICFSEKDNSGKVYLWDVENNKFSDIWNSFSDWLTQEIDDAIKLIGDGALEPLGIKMDGDSDE